jgi:hypothetical protein
MCQLTSANEAEAALLSLCQPPIRVDLWALAAQLFLLHAKNPNVYGFLTGWMLKSSMFMRVLTGLRLLYPKYPYPLAPAHCPRPLRALSLPNQYADHFL